MNLRTRRLTERRARRRGRRRAGSARRGACRVADRLGDAGLTGIVSVEVDGRRRTLVDFVLSCRVMGRRVEETMLHLAA